MGRLGMIAGIDFSTYAIDVVFLHPESATAEWRRFQLREKGKGNSFDGARAVYLQLFRREMWAERNVVQIAIERPYGHPAVVTALMRIQGAIVACLPTNIPVVELSPAEWKFELCGKGGATKAAVAKATLSYFPSPSADQYPQDAFDACGLAVALCSLAARGRPVD